MAHPGPDHAPDAAWPRYYQASQGRTPRPLFMATLARAHELGLCSPNALAVDLGCGAGVETLALIEQGWHVLAVDQQAAAINAVIDLVPAPWQAQLETQVCAFEDLVLPPASLIYAGFSLPFCPPKAFNRFWDRLRSALLPGGLFAAQFFGKHDNWAQGAASDLTLHTEAQLRQRLQGWHIEQLLEIERNEALPEGHKHWHYFSVLAKRPNLAPSQHTA
jgi:tellurite methyltransferase